MCYANLWRNSYRNSSALREDGSLQATPAPARSNCLVVVGARELGGPSF